MRTVNLRDGILYPVADMLGIDPTQDLGRDHARAWVSFLNSRVRYAWEFWPWPELTPIEERAYRTIWSATRRFNKDDELFYITDFAYYKAIADAPVGTLPTNATYFEPWTLNDFYIELDQVGQTPIDQVYGIYAGNPRNNGSVAHPLKYRPSNKGIDVQPYGSGLTTFVRYRIRPSQFTTIPYDPTRTYHRRDEVYWSDGDCYAALQTVAGHAPDESAYWYKVPMPYILAEYATSAVAADAADDLQSTQLFRGDAVDALECAVDRLQEQGEINYYKRARHCGYWSYAPFQSNAWIASPPWATDGSTTTLTEEDSPFAEEGQTMLDDGVTPIPNGQSYVDVTLNTEWPDANYNLDELVILNNVDNPPININVSIVTGQTTTGFRAMLNTPPDNDHYFLKWRITD